MEANRIKGTNRIKETVVEKYGRKDKLDPEFLAELEAKYSKERIQRLKTADLKHQNAVSSLLDLSEKGNSTYLNKAPLLRYGHLALKQLWEQALGLDYKLNYLQKSRTNITAYKLNNIACFLASLKIIAPNSYLKSFNNQSRYLSNPLSGICRDNIYAALDNFNDFKEELMQHAVDNYRKYLGISKPKLVFFDCTNCYIETPYDDSEQFIQKFTREVVDDLIEHEHSPAQIKEFLSSPAFAQSLEQALEEHKEQFIRIRGPSKEGRFSLPIISIAMVIDENAVPIDFEIFAGNKSEFKTIKPTIDRLKEKYKIQNSYFVADRGLNSTENLDLILKENLGSIVAQKVTGLNATQSKELFSPDGWKTIDFKTMKTEFLIFDKDETTECAFKYKVCDFKKKSYVTSPNTNKKCALNDACKIMYTFSEKRRSRDLNDINEAVAKANNAVSEGKFMGNPYGNGWRAFVLTQKELASDNKKDKEQHRAVGLNEAAINKKKELAGYAAIVYQDPQNGKYEITEQEVLTSYKSLVKIEECFRIMKSDFCIRPMYVKLYERTRAHCLLCVLALMMLRIVQIQLARRNIHATSHDIAESLNNAFLTAIPSSDLKDIVFVNSRSYHDIYKTDCASKVKGKSADENDILDAKKIAADYLASKIKNKDLVDEILDICTLKPLPMVANTKTVKSHLKISVKQTDIVDETIKGILDELKK